MKRSGWTLLEVLCAMTIVAILSSLAGGAYRLAVNKAKDNGCVAHLRTFGQAINLYANAYDDYLPPYLTRAQYRAGVPGARIEARPDLWRASLAGYVRSEEVFYCPFDRTRGRDPVLGPDWDSSVTSYQTRIAHGDIYGEAGTYRQQLADASARGHGYLEDAQYLVPRRPWPRTPFLSLHGDRTNVLYHDGHVKSLSLVVRIVGPVPQ